MSTPKPTPQKIEQVGREVVLVLVERVPRAERQRFVPINVSYVIGGDVDVFRFCYQNFDEWFDEVVNRGDDSNPSQELRPEIF